jgi:hypothetical protein
MSFLAPRLAPPWLLREQDYCFADHVIPRLDAEVGLDGEDVGSDSLLFVRLRLLVMMLWLGQPAVPSLPQWVRLPVSRHHQVRDLAGLPIHLYGMSIRTTCAAVTSPFA